MRERWRPVVGHEGCYEVSDMGRVRSLSRTWRQKSRGGGTYQHTMVGKVLRPGAGYRAWQQPPCSSTCIGGFRWPESPR